MYGISCGKDEKVSRFLEPNESSLMVEAMLDELAQEAKALFYPFVFKNPKVSRILPTLLGIQQSNV